MTRQAGAGERLSAASGLVAASSGAQSGCPARGAWPTPPPPPPTPPPQPVPRNPSPSDQPDDDDEFEEDDDDGEVADTDGGVVFSASVAKGDSRLVFECQSDGTYLQVMSVTLEPAAGEAGDSAYVGPVFDELDERLQAEFEAYLEARGVTPELGAYLGVLVGDKEQREYVAWLQRVRSFVAE